MKRCCTTDGVGKGKSATRVAASAEAAAGKKVRDANVDSNRSPTVAELTAVVTEEKGNSATDPSSAKEPALQEAVSETPRADLPSLTPVTESSQDVSSDPARDSSVDNSYTEVGAADANNEEEANESAAKSFDQMVDMLTALVMKDAIEEVQRTIRNTNYQNFKKLETLVKFGEDAATHILKDVVSSLREEFCGVQEEIREEELEKDVMDGLKDEAVMEGGKESSVEKDSNNDTSHEPKTAVNPNDLCDVIVEECSDSSRSSSSSSSSEDESSSSDEEINEDRDDSDESSDELDRAKDSSPPVDAIPGLFERSLKVEEKSSAESSSSTTGIVADTAAVAATAAAAATAAERFSPTEEENVFDQYFEPVCRRCRELRALLLEVDEDVEADAMEFHFTLEQLGDKTGPPIICSLCMKDGHYKDACPDEVLPGEI